MRNKYLEEEIFKKYSGLNEEEISISRAKHGVNVLGQQKKGQLLHITKNIITEPMFILLVVVCGIYFGLGQLSEGLIMIGAIAMVSGISLFQEVRGSNALEALKKLSQSKVKVIRNRKTQEVHSEELVVGDIMILDEGENVPADALILQAHDFSVDESILTGESFTVTKDSKNNNQIYHGTTITSGSVVATVSNVGIHTQLGKLGKSIEGMEDVKTPLKIQIDKFVRRLALMGFIAFILVLIINYFNTHNLLLSLLFGLTLAMAILPEEIPVAFSYFMALGAVRLIKDKVLTKHPQTVESLGSATVICIDKTGTITENKMSVAKIYDFKTNQLLDPMNEESTQRIISYAMWASEVIPFDPMEVAIHETYAQTTKNDIRSNYKMVHEYPLSGNPPMMTHIFESIEGEKIIAGKGGPEQIMNVSHLSDEQKKYVNTKTKELANLGFRILGVASARYDEQPFPSDQRKFNWSFEGLIALYDPPKKNISQVLKHFDNAGITVKLITGDYPETALAIAKEINFKGHEHFITGNEILEMNEENLKKTVNMIQVYARMYPQAKLKVINALKSNGEVVAMTGDGVNDGPALKAAHIGVAMGKRGTEVARRAASIILLDDDLEKMVKAIRLGRKTYHNLKKAIRYILSIHVPILLVVTVPLLLGWKYPHIFSPIHVIFLELIMGPTCSIIYENEPIEENLMQKKPRKLTHTFLTFKELLLSIIQGIVIAIGVLALYAYSIEAAYDEYTTRTLVFSTLLLSNIFLTFTSRSFEYSIFRTIKYRNWMVPLIVSLTFLFLIAIIHVPSIQTLFECRHITNRQIGICIGVAFISVMWIELYKAILKFWRYLGSHQFFGD